MHYEYDWPARPRVGVMAFPQLSDWYANAQFLQHCGQKLSYCDNERDAEALVLLHGFPNSSRDWHKLWALLDPQYRLIAPDFLGYGRSDKPGDYDYSLMDQADQVIHLLSHLGIRRAHFMGHSSAITVCQELLALVEMDHDPDLPEIASLCFLNGSIIPGKAPTIMEQRLIKTQGTDVVRNLDVHFLHHVMDALAGSATPLDDDEAELHWAQLEEGGGLRVVKHLLHFMDERSQHQDRWLKAMCVTEIPMLAIIGASDPVWGAALGEQLGEDLPFLDIEYIQDAGHYVYLQAPEQLSLLWRKYQMQVAA